MASTKTTTKRRIGIVGYGHLGQFLTQAILNHEDMELAFVWNRTKTVFEEENLLPKHLILDKLEDCGKTQPDLIVEVAHPIVVKQVKDTLHNVLYTHYDL